MSDWNIYREDAEQYKIWTFINLHTSQADDILEKLETILAPGYTTNIDDFSASINVETEKFHPIGELVNSFSWKVRGEKELPPQAAATADGTRAGPVANGKARNGVNGVESTLSEKTFEIYNCDATNPKFKSYLERMQQFLLWFVDAATFIDINDEKWKLFVM